MDQLHQNHSAERRSWDPMESCKYWVTVSVVEITSAFKISCFNLTVAFISFDFHRKEEIATDFMPIKKDKHSKAAFT